MKEILRKIIEKETGRVFAVEPILADVQKIAKEVENGTHWVIGQNDDSMMWEYHIEKRENIDQGRTVADISILEIKITDKLENKTWNVKIRGNSI